MNSQLYFGVVEDRNDPLKLGRCRVRIARCHTHDLSILPTSDLPWATVLQPISGGRNVSALSPVEGTAVAIQFYDYPTNQIPVVVGTIPTIPQEQSVFIDQDETIAILKDELTPQGRSIPTNDMDATGGTASVVIEATSDSPNLQSIQKEGILSNGNSKSALMDSMLSVNSVQTGSVGALGQFEQNIGQATKQRKDEFESLLLKTGDKQKAIETYGNILSEKITSSIPSEILNGNETWQNVLETCNAYFQKNGLTNIPHSIGARIETLNLTDPKQYVSNLSNGLDDLKTLISNEYVKMSDSVNEPLQKISEFDVNKVSATSLTKELMSSLSLQSFVGNQTIGLSSPKDMVNLLGNGYASKTAESNNIGNLNAITKQGVENVTSNDFIEVGEGNTPPSQGTFGGANFGGAEPQPVEIPSQNTEKFPNGVSREPNWETIGNPPTSLVVACAKHGLVTTESRCAFFAILHFLNGWKCKGEEFNYSIEELFSRFPISFSEKESLAKKYSLGKVSEQNFFNFVYDASNDGRTYGNYYPSDGYTYSSYGFIPIVGRSHYTRLSKQLSNDKLLKNGRSELENNESLCAEIAVVEFLSRTKGISPTAHPQFLYSACKVFGLNPRDIEPTYCKLYGANTQSMYGVGEKLAGNTVAPNSYYPNKSPQTETGYIDRNHKYPLDRLTSESTTNRLSKGDIRDTIVARKEQERRIGIPLPFNMGTFDQPHSAYGAKYPFNDVTETESGHIVEFDDTPQHERIHLYHRKGTFVEIDENGSKVTRIVGDGYTILDRNGFISVDGGANVTVGGNVNIFCRSNANIQVEGSAEMKVGGNFNLGVAKDFNLAVNGNTNISSNGAINLHAHKNANILSDEKMFIAGTKEMHLKTDGTFFETAKTSMDISCLGEVRKRFDKDVDTIIRGNSHTQIDANNFTLIGQSSKTEITENSDVFVGKDLHEHSDTRNITVDNDFNTKTKTTDMVSENGTKISAKTLDCLTSDNTNIQSSSTNIKSGSSTNIQSGATTNVKSGASSNIQSGASTNIKSAGSTNIGGTTVNLNGGSIGGAGSASGASKAKNASQTEKSEGADVATDATKAIVYGMIPPPLGNPLNVNIQPLRRVKPIGEDEFLIETAEDTNSAIAQSSMKAMVAEEGVSLTDYGETAKPIGSSDAYEESPYREVILNTENFTADFQISEHIKLGMMFDGGFNNRHKLINQAGLTKQEIVLNLSRLAHNVIEKYLSVLPNGIQGYNKLWRITSGYRMCGTNSPRVSDHCKGRACDIQLSGRNKQQHWKIVQEMEKLVAYDQLLLEYRGRYSVWIHTGFRGEANRKMACTFVNDRRFTDGFTLVG